MSRRGGRDRFRPRELRGVIVPLPGPRITLYELFAAGNRQREAIAVSRWDGMCSHGVPWMACTICSRKKGG